MIITSSYLKLLPFLAVVSFTILLKFDDEFLEHIGKQKIEEEKEVYIINMKNCLSNGIPLPAQFHKYYYTFWSIILCVITLSVLVCFMRWPSLTQWLAIMQKPKTSSLFSTKSIKIIYTYIIITSAAAAATTTSTTKKTQENKEDNNFSYGFLPLRFFVASSLFLVYFSPSCFIYSSGCLLHFWKIVIIDFIIQQFCVLKLYFFSMRNSFFFLGSFFFCCSKNLTKTIVHSLSGV